MRNKIVLRSLILLTAINISASSVLGYHDSEHSGAAISIPSYSEPTSFLIYLVLPGLLMFFAVQQPIERKLQGKWRRNEPARKYSSIVAFLVVGISVISPVFHSFPTLETPYYAGFLVLMASTALLANKWSQATGKLPV